MHACRRFTAFTLLLPLAVMAAGTPLRPGLWEIRLQMVVDGETLPGGDVPRRLCMNDRDVADTAFVAAIGEYAGDPHCALSNLRTVGNKTSWDLVCSGPEPGRQHAEFTLAGDRYDGLIVVRTEEAGNASDMQMRYSGQRLGGCP